MNITMSGLAYNRAALPVREKFAFSPEQAQTFLQWLRQQEGVAGCVLLSTCNRTELYISGSVSAPWLLLCQGLHISPEAAADCFITHSGQAAAQHLMEVACGLHSQILGEGQIITQVRKAWELAQQAESADAALSALFRCAVTAGKRARTQVSISRHAPSLGTRCRDVLAQELGSLAGKKILVIGNGQMGRLAAELLQQAGAQVWVTLRTYRHGQTLVPAGCRSIPYADRAAALEGMDALVSATASPHYTICASQLASLAQQPQVAIDLAVPRDIDPECAQYLRLYDTDALGVEAPGDAQAMEAMAAIAREELERYLQWQQRQESPVTYPRFPLFLDLTGKKVVLVGGGKIAARRIASLRLFGCCITVISPTLCCSDQGLTWLPRPYAPGDLEGAVLAIAATDDRAVNHQVGLDADALGIPVSVADRESECSFYFPAVCTGQDLIAGVVSTGKDHHKTARAAKAVRRALEELT